MSRETIASLSATLLPFLLVALAALGARLVAFAAQHIRDKRLSVAVQLAAYGAAAVVADVAQHVVADLKDPTKPGTWDRVAMSSARTTAIARVRKLYPGAVAVITAALRDPGKVEELLGTLVERAVVELKAPGLGGASVDPLLAPPSPSKVPAPIPPAQGGFARLGAVALLFAVSLCIAGLGAVLTGCPNWNRPACPRAGVYSCVGDQPHVCSPTGELTPIGDEPCGLQRRACAVDDAGVAYCARAEDGGAQ